MRKDKRSRIKINTKLPRRRNDEHEFPKGVKGITLCKDCSIAFYKKSWHHNLRGHKSLSPDIQVKFDLCPACRMIKNNQFEGEVNITQIPEKEVGGVIKLVEGYGRRAYEDDPLDRIISIRRLPRGTGYEDVVVTTTENQLAQRIANKVRDAFNKVKIVRSFSKEPSDVVFITVEFLS